MNAPISVLAVDDHPVFADALRARLGAERDLDPVVVAYNLVDAMQRVAAGGVDVALVDYTLGDSTGVELAGRIRDVSPTTAVIMLSAVDSVDAIVDALAAGARSWLRKTVDTAHLVRVVHRVVDGEIWLDPPTVNAVVPRLLDLAFRSSDGALAVLTAREREILDHLAEAYDRRDIAVQLGISENTVRTHIQNLLAKLDVHSSVEAVSLLLRSRRTGS